MTTAEILSRAVKAKGSLKNLGTEEKNNAIEAMAKSIEKSAADILAENCTDVEQARGTIGEVMLDRLALNEARIESIVKGMRDVALLPDPNGRVLTRVERPNGLVIEKVAVPMGVIGIIYESRPNVTSDAAVLCFKSSNVCVLR
ncbi:MAG: gamma-glutamyl-phosphate reductase, partial [Clostridia bacterium]|nr:gamma-glutamyl-phosphate reductase [Clostridia bacterium]